MADRSNPLPTPSNPLPTTVFPPPHTPPCVGTPPPLGAGANAGEWPLPRRQQRSTAGVGIFDRASWLLPMVPLAPAGGGWPPPFEQHHRGPLLTVLLQTLVRCHPILSVRR